MIDVSQKVETPGRCRACGSPVDSMRLDGLCPSCTWRLISDCDGSGPDELPANDSLLFLPGYVVLEEIARGGMGIVYRARQLSPARVVAIKMLLPHQLGSAEMRERFRLETETIAGLEHPSILPVYHVGEQDGMPFFAMKFASGGTLVEKKAGFNGKFREIAELLATLADAVQFAHARGVLHRDLKPGNILFDEQGRAYVSDFGLAKLVSADTDLTRSVAFFGTPHYLAPEIAAGSARQATTSSDIYSLGAILYELLAGDVPFRADNLAGLLRQITDAEPAFPSAPSRVSREAKTLPRDLEVICLKCLAKEPARRYASAREFAEDLRRWLSGNPILARAPTALERFTAWGRRNPALAGVSSLLISVLIVTAFMQLRSAHRMRQALAQSLLAQAHLRRSDGRAGQRFESLGLIERAAEYAPTKNDAASRRLAAELRTEVAGALALPDVRPKSRWPAPITNFENEFDFVSDLSRYVAGTAEGGMALFSTAGHQMLWSIPGQKHNPTIIMAVSPDGSWAAASFQDGHVELHCITNRFEPQIWPGGNAHSCFAFSSDGKKFAIALDQNSGPELQLLDLTGSAKTKVSLDSPATALTFSPDAKQVAIAGRGLEVWNLDESKAVWSIPLTHKVSTLAWSTDKKRLAYALERRTEYKEESIEGYPVFVVDAASGKQRSLFVQAGKTVQRLAFDPTGESLAAASWDGELILGALDPSGFRLKIEGMQRALRFSPDGKSLAYSPSKEELAILEINPSTVFREWSAVSPAEHDIYTLVTSRDGRWLATGGSDTVRIWDTTDRRELASIPIKSKVWWVEVHFSPDNKYFYYSAVSFGVHRVELIQTTLPDGTVRLSLGRDEAISDSGYMVIGFAADGKSLIVGETRRKEQNDLTPPTVWLWPDGDPTRARKLAENFPLVGYRAIPRRGWGVSTDIVKPDLWVWDFAAAQRIRSLGIPHPVMSELTSDGEWIITRTREEFAVWKTGSWKKSFSWVPPEDERGAPSLVASPDNRMLATKTTDDRMVLRRLPDGEKLLELPPPHRLQAAFWAFSPDNTRLFLLLNTGEVAEWNLAAVRRELAQHHLDWE